MYCKQKGLRLRAKLHHNKDVCEVCFRENRIKEAIRNVEVMVKKTTPSKTLLHKIFKIEPRSIFQDALDKWEKDLLDYQSKKERDYREF